MNTLAIAVLCCVIQVTLFLLAAGLLYALAQRQGPRQGARVASGSLFVVALLTLIIASPWPNWTHLATDSAPAFRAPTHQVADTHTRNSGEAAHAPPLEPNPMPPVSVGQEGVAPWLELVQAAWNKIQESPAANESEATAAWVPTWRHATALLFAALASIGLLRLVSGAIGVAQIKSRSVPLHDPSVNEVVEQLRTDLACRSSIAIRQCASLTTAATIGWRRPIILLPANWREWQAPELRAVLAHEIAHICRRDFAMQAIAQVGVALHFYHPLVHWLASRLRLEQEMAADAMAASVTGGQRLYLASLARMALAQPSTRLSWPVHAFLPTRHTFLRRIEMLRDRDIELSSHQESNVRRRAWGALCAAALVAAGIAAAGLRAPALAQNPPETPVAGEQSVAPSTTETPDSSAPIDSTRYDFSYIPDNFLGLVAVRPAELAADPRLLPLANLLEENTRPSIPSELAQQLTLLLIAPDLDDRGMVQRGSGGEQIVIHTTAPFDFESSLRRGYPDLANAQNEGRELLVISPSPTTMSFFAPNKQTLVGRARTGLLKLLSDKNAAQPHASAATWQSAASGPLLAVANSASIATLLRHESHPDSWRMKALFVPLLESTEWLLVSVEPGEQLTLQGRLVCKSPEDAAKAAETLSALAVLAGNSLDTLRPSLSNTNQSLPLEQMEQAMLDLAGRVVINREITVRNNEVRFQTTLGETDATVRMIVDKLAPSIRQARDAAREVQDLNNLKQIALAMLIYESTNKHLPPAVLYGPDGKTPHSWRVAILPYLDQQALYNQYRFDEPWDSENNRKVLAQMPAVYRHPQDEAGSTNTSYFVLTGPETLFPGKQGTTFQQITDGTSNTLLVVEAKRDIPWTKPEDIDYAADEPLPELGGWFPGKFLAAFSDGSTRAIDQQQFDETTLRAFITKAGGEPTNSRNP